MNVLVAYASKHGSTEEIAEVIANVVRETGLTVDLKRASDVHSVVEYDAVVLGSSIYVGQWHRDAMFLIDKFDDLLRNRNVWLFSSGPIGEEPFPADDPPVTKELVDRTGAREHQSFLGKLDRARLGFGERFITSVLRAPDGDFRDWEAIRAWAIYIAHSLQEESVAATRQTAG